MGVGAMPQDGWGRDPRAPLAGEVEPDVHMSAWAQIAL